MAAAWPSCSRAQAPPFRVIGFLNPRSPVEWAPFLAAFRNGLSDMGYVEGRNLSIEFRWQFNDLDQSVARVQELVDRGVDVLVTTGGHNPTLAAKRVTSSIPIVATFIDDPASLGMLASLDRPGGNVTGVSLDVDGVASKQFALLRELVPKATVIALLVDPRPGVVDLRKYQDAARGLGQQIYIVNANTDDELDAAFATARQQGCGALLCTSVAHFLERPDLLAGLAARYEIPALYPARAYVDAGGLISYGVDRKEAYYQLGLLTGRILKHNVTPAEMPVRRPTKFELAINLKTARALGLTVPPSLVTLADVVIQ